MDAKKHAVDAPPLRITRWLTSARLAASRVMVFSRQTPFQDEFKLKLNSFSAPIPDRRDGPLAESVEHLTRAS